MWIAEVYLHAGNPIRLRIWLWINWAKRKSRKSNCYKFTNVKGRKKKRLTQKFKTQALKYRWYKEEWDRSSHYREKFFRQKKQKRYRCRYCNRSLKKADMEVDHLIPVSKVKDYSAARILLKFSCKSPQADVNHINNLVPSCHKCNNRKSDKMGLWYVRGILGRYRLYWLILGMIKIGFFFATGYVIGRYFL